MTTNSERRVEIVSERLVELLTQRRDGILVDRLIGGLQCGNLRNQLLICAHCVV